MCVVWAYNVMPLDETDEINIVVVELGSLQLTIIRSPCVLLASGRDKDVCLGHL